MVQAEDEPTAVAAANAKARADWETSDGEYPSGRELGEECPVCTGAQVVSSETLVSSTRPSQVWSAVVKR